MRRLLKSVCAIFVLLIIVVPQINAQDKTPTFEDILNLKSPGSISISPDGNSIIYTVSTPNWEDNNYVTQIWIVDVNKGENRQITYNEKSSSNIAWSPDGKYISFVSSRDEKSQIYLLPLAGGEARKVTDTKTGVRGYEWSPDGKWFAYTTTDETPKKTKNREKKYGRWEVFEEEFNIAHLWLCNIESGESAKVIDRDDLHVSSFSWSPDGSKIAFSANPDSMLKSFSKSDLYLLDVESKEISTLVQQFGPDSGPVWSPDGKYIAFTSSMGTETYFVNNTIAVIPAGGGDIKTLTDSFDENTYLAYWKENGIFFAAFQRMSMHFFRIDDNGVISQLTKGDLRRHGGFSLSKDGSKLAVSYTSAKDYSDIYITDTNNYSPEKLSDFSAQLDGWKLATKEAISWKSTDGVEITGNLIKPADFDANKKYPLMVIIHGGPTGISMPSKIQGYSRTYPVEQWVEKGAVVLEPNYRGSAGFGADFRKLNYRNLGVGDYWDVISGVDYLIGQGFVDEKKVCSMGWSQGGYITAFITTFSDRFLATSVGAGISDWVDYYYRTDITPFCFHYLGNTPWKDPEVYAKTSPMTHINNAKTPTLIQHGENDARVPVNNGYKLHRALKDNGVPVKFIIYKGFGHGITKPKERLAVLTHNWHWFNKYVWGEEAPDELLIEDMKEEEPEK